MAKLRRSTRRPTAVKKAKASVPTAKTKARPAVKITGARPARPVVAKKPAKAKAAARRAAKPAAKLKARGAIRTRRQPRAQIVPKQAGKAGTQPRRSTYADAVVLYERGLQALQGKRYRDAAEILKRVIAEFPEEKELHERAELYIRVCARQLTPPDATPKTPEEQVYAATLAVNAGAFDRAIALLTVALQQKKDNDSAEYMFGVVLSMKGDQHGALAHFARAVELNPDSRELLRKEPELEALRQTDELKALLAAPPAPARKERRPQPRGRR
jgi:tetratricopeptide (TPR) repeat protein